MIVIIILDQYFFLAPLPYDRSFPWLRKPTCVGGRSICHHQHPIHHRSFLFSFPAFLYHYNHRHHSICHHQHPIHHQCPHLQIFLGDRCYLFLCWSSPIKIDQNSPSINIVIGGRSICHHQHPIHHQITLSSKYFLFLFSRTLPFLWRRPNKPLHVTSTSTASAFSLSYSNSIQIFWEFSSLSDPVSLLCSFLILPSPCHLALLFSFSSNHTPIVSPRHGSGLLSPSPPSPSSPSSPPSPPQTTLLPSGLVQYCWSRQSSGPAARDYWLLVCLVSSYSSQPHIITHRHWGPKPLQKSEESNKISEMPTNNPQRAARHLTKLQKSFQSCHTNTNTNTNKHTKTPP